jgi:hypothetical protein
MVITCVASQKLLSSTACIICMVSPSLPRLWATISVEADDRRAQRRHADGVDPLENSPNKMAPPPSRRTTAEE